MSRLWRPPISGMVGVELLILGIAIVTMGIVFVCNTKVRKLKLASGQVRKPVVWVRPAATFAGKATQL